MSGLSNVELLGSVRKVLKHPLHKTLYKDVELNQDLSQSQKNVQGEVIDEYQKVQEIKQKLANQKGVAVTSEEHAVEFEKKACELKDKSDEEIDKELDEFEHDECVEKNREIQLAKKAVEQVKKEDLIEKIQCEMAAEQERAKLLLMMENSRKNAIDSARATYGPKADISAIQQSYDMVMNSLDPKINDMTDMVSMAIDNKLHGDKYVKMLMPNGSIRTMDADVAFALSELPRQKNMSQESEDDVILQETVYTNEELELLYELRDLIDSNAKRQADFEYKDPKSGEVEVKSKREQRFRQIGLPTVAMDYDYVYYLDETTTHNGRALPSAMDSYAMQPGLQGDGKTYGYYK